MIKVVIYDDNDARRKSLEVLLQLSEGVECIGAFTNCSHVIADMEALQPDVVLMDIEMPVVNGIDGVRLIKQYYPGIKIIMQTVFEDSDKIFAALQAGAEGYILKSTPAPGIIQSITDVYKGGAFMTPSVALRVMKYFNTKPAPEHSSASLTTREKEALKYLTEGLSHKMVADKMGISYFTVNAHVKKIYEKLQVHSVGEAISYALKNNIV
ncbi:MAG TPA: response regulator transcription factor [Ferruginibacter sp.]|nr:response regulator transcription factor [Ferruginibacter sp.]HMP19529.1 response regulator transcription factor [Ferruginibacter sp.]